MLWHSQSELETEGPPTRKDMFWVMAATPFLILQIVGWGRRLVGGLQGEPLTVSGWFDIHVLRSDPGWHFAAAVAMYLVFTALALLLLWACSLQLQRWLFWRHRS